MAHEPIQPFSKNAPGDFYASPLTLREKLERLRGADDEPRHSPPAHDDHPLYDQELDR
jgi:hypothetical protein